MDRVVPFAMKTVRANLHGGEILVRHVLLGGIGSGVQSGADVQPGLGRGTPDEVNDDLVTDPDSVPSCVGEIGGGVGGRESEASLVC